MRLFVGTLDGYKLDSKGRLSVPTITFAGLRAGAERGAGRDELHPERASQA